MEHHPLYAPVVYTPEQYAHVVDVWENLLNTESASLSISERHTFRNGFIDRETLLSEILTDGRGSIELEIAMYGYSTGPGDSAVARSNVEWLAHNYDPYVRDMCSDGRVHRAVVALGELPNIDETVDGNIRVLSDLANVIGALDDYPVIDDEHLSDTETEIVRESWDAFLRREFERELSHVWETGDVRIPKRLRDTVADAEELAEYAVEHHGAMIRNHWVETYSGWFEYGCDSVYVREFPETVGPLANEIYRWMDF